MCNCSSFQRHSGEVSDHIKELISAFQFEDADRFILNQGMKNPLIRFQHLVSQIAIDPARANGVEYEMCRACQSLVTFIGFLHWPSLIMPPRLAREMVGEPLQYAIDIDLVYLHASLFLGQRKSVPDLVGHKNTKYAQFLSICAKSRLDGGITPKMAQELKKKCLADSYHVFLGNLPYSKPHQQNFLLKPISQLDEADSPQMTVVRTWNFDNALGLGQCLDRIRTNKTLEPQHFKYLDHLATWAQDVLKRQFSNNWWNDTIKAHSRHIFQEYGIKSYLLYAYSLLEKQETLTPTEIGTVADAVRFSGDEKLCTAYFMHIKHQSITFPLYAIVSSYFHCLYSLGPFAESTQIFYKMLVTGGGKRQRRKKRRSSALRTQDLHIGILTSDLKAHAVADFSLPLFLANGARRTVFFGGQPDANTNVFIANTDEWRVTRELNALELGDEINRSDCDLIIDLGGLVPNAQSAGLNKVNKPVVGYIGAVGSTSRFFNDYFLVDPILNENNILKREFSEKLIELPAPWMRYKKINPMIRYDSDALDSNPLLGVINDPRKIGPRTIKAIQIFLSEHPKHCVLFRHSFFNRHWAQSIYSKICDKQDFSKQLIFDLKPKSNIEHHQTFNRLWACLDPCDAYGGATSTCDALMMGVPVIHFEGSTYNTRWAKSFNHGVGLEEFNYKVDELNQITDAVYKARAFRTSQFLRYVRHESKLSNVEAAADALMTQLTKVI